MQCPFQVDVNPVDGKHRMFQHRRVHNETRYQCDQCHRSYKERNKLKKKHMKERHSNMEHGKTFKCEFCDFEAKSETMLKRHEDTMKKYGEEAHTSI